MWAGEVHLGCYHKVLQAEWLLNNRNIFLTVLGAGMATTGPADPCPVKRSFQAPVLRAAARGGRGRALSHRHQSHPRWLHLQTP